MPKKGPPGKSSTRQKADDAPGAGRPSALLDTRVSTAGECLEQLKKLADACIA